MSPNLKENVSNTSTWGRALFMILFGIIYSIAEVVISAVVVIQFLFVLFSAEKNQRLLGFGKELSTFVYQVFLYLTFNSEEKPFPFADWPKESAVSDSVTDESEVDTEIESESHTDKTAGDESKPTD